MEIQEAYRDNISVLRPMGRIDSSTAPEFHSKLQEAVGAAEGGVIVDFSDVEYISSAGLRSLMTAIRQRKDRRLAAAALKPVIKEIFEIARFQHVIKIFGSVEQAASAWEPSAPTA